MIPRTVQMAAEVAAQLTSTQLDDYGNIILNGYSEPVLADMTNGAVGAIDTLQIINIGGGYTPGTYTNVYLGAQQGSFAYGTVVINGGGNLSSITLTANGQNYVVGETISFSIPGGSPTPALVQVDSVNTYTNRPALKGWTTNYQEYYTQLQPNGYGVNPGDPTMFTYSQHSFTPQTGPLQSINYFTPGTGYTPGFYAATPLTGGAGAGATADITVAPDPDPTVVGFVQTVTIINPGTGYLSTDVLSAVLPGGTGFKAYVGSINAVPGTGNVPRWAQPPHRFYQNQVAPTTPPTNNSQVIPYSFMYPVADSLAAPPIDTL